MVDVFRALAEKKRRLLGRKQQLTDDYKAQMAEIDREIEEIDKSISTINDAVQPLLCPCCQGTGEERFLDAAGSRDARECSACHGTGIRNGEKERGNQK